MKTMIKASVAAISAILLTGGSVIAQVPAAPAAPAPFPLTAPALTPAYSVNLASPEGMAALGAQWRTQEAKLVEGAPIPNSGPAYPHSYELSPRAHIIDFDDSAWTVVEPKIINSGRFGGGKVSFLWFRTNLTIPAKIGDFDTTNTRAVLTVVVDDYAEVWVNGEMPRRAGVVSPGSIQGFNMPNRVTLTQAAKPGEKISVAVFAINGPISAVPMNGVFFREAHIDFYR